MKSRLYAALALGCLAGFALALASCGSSGCSPSNCQGCCSGGVCEPGDTDAICGGKGVACTACASTESCVTHICETSGAGGGAAATDDAGCELIDLVSLQPQVVYTPDAGNGHSAVDAYVGSPTSTQTSQAFATLELFYPAGQFPMGARTVPLGPVTFQSCSDCVYFDDGCDPTSGVCTHSYLAQGGTLAISAFSLAPGTLTGTASNLHFVEWDFTNDVPVPAGLCVDVTSMAYAGTW